MLDKTPDARVRAFLEKFEAALAKPDLDAAMRMFGDECYWRDLVAFTWNIRTMEGRDQVRAMLEHRLADVKPRDWRIAEGEEASESEGTLEAWIAFETQVARGYGLIRHVLAGKLHRLRFKGRKADQSADNLGACDRTGYTDPPNRAGVFASGDFL